MDIEEIAFMFSCRETADANSALSESEIQWPCSTTSSSETSFFVCKSPITTLEERSFIKSGATMSPKTIPPITVMDFAFMFPRILAFSPIITFPLASMFPSISPSIRANPFILASPFTEEPAPRMLLMKYCR